MAKIASKEEYDVEEPLPLLPTAARNGVRPDDDDDDDDGDDDSDVAVDGNYETSDDEKGQQYEEQDSTNTTTTTTSTDNNNNNNNNIATIRQVFSFGSGPRKVLGLIVGMMAALVAGAVGPFMIFFFANAFSDLVADPTSDEYLEQVRDLAFTFLVLGVVALVSLSTYSTCLETAAGEMAMDLKTKWFQALLRQDLAYFDLRDVSGTAMTISINGAKYKRGVGNKLGLGIQFVVTFLGGFGYAFYSSWRTSLLVLAIVPFMAASGWFLVKMNTSQTQRANAAYAKAGSTVYTTISSIRTILSLNAAHAMIQNFETGTEEAYNQATSQVHWLGLANGSVMSSFLILFCIVPIFGAYLLYDQVRDSGCDPSGAVPGAEACDPSGIDVFGSLFGMVFGASVLPQISTVTESFTEARSACYLAIETINRKVEDNDNLGGEGKINDKAIDQKGGEEDEEEEEVLQVQQHTEQQEQSGNTTKYTDQLPKYTIDSSCPDGEKPTLVNGRIEFRNVTFAYPSRSKVNVLESFNLTIEAGKTTAIVGPSGSGKSSIVQLIERFYDPSSLDAGCILLDGHDLRDLNVKWLRQQIGMVGQEPSLFACSISDNIAHGLPGATFEQIQAAAKSANAHDFILTFPDGYNTQVGDKGAKLSGGQKQRIAIARALIKSPKILLLDEATSALDSESERTVQKSIDQLLDDGKYTAIVVAHRLSTVRNADKIIVVENGQVVETGTHEELIEMGGHYCNLVKSQLSRQEATSDGPPAQQDKTNNSTSRSSSSSNNEEAEAVEEKNVKHHPEKAPILEFKKVHFAYPSRPGTAVFRGLNLQVLRGETLAIVGPSGHGKSSIIQLAERFYDPSKGSINFDGVDLKSLNVQWLRRQIGLVSQEPVLFDTTIAENIRFGIDNATRGDIKMASIEANAHNFIMSFPDGYETQVGQAGTQVSGGQKQRICIARALLRRPRILLLDEATSALDSQSEKVVQAALDRIMASRSQTTVVIAHRLSTVRNASRIAVVFDGKVREIGTYEELMSKPKGHFQRLQAYQNLEGPVEDDTEKTPSSKKGKSGEAKKVQTLRDKKRKEREEAEQEEKEIQAIDAAAEKQFGARARQLAQKDVNFFLIGGIGALLAGLMFPAWGFIFAYTIELLYTPVQPCPMESDCQSIWDSTADDMKVLAVKLAISSGVIVVTTLVGYMWLYYGFGTATERINKRVRDSSFLSLIRQEVAYFDLQPAGSLTARLQDDAALIHSFSGQPIRALIISLSSVLVGLIIGFIYMWPFALVFLGVLPFLGFGAEMEMRMYIKSEDEGDDSVEEEHSPGGIVIESLLNMRTVASLTMEETKLTEYTHALKAEDPNPVLSNLLKGSGFGLGQFFQMWGMGLMFWFGAWVLHEHPNLFSFRDFLISMFALFFCLYGLTVAFEGATDRKKAKLAAARIFELTDRESQIDPLGEGGWKGEDDGTRPKVNKMGSKRKSSKSSSSPKQKSKKKLTMSHEKDVVTNKAEAAAEMLASNNENKKGSSKNLSGKGHDDYGQESPGNSKEKGHRHHHHANKKSSSKKLSAGGDSPHGREALTDESPSSRNHRHHHRQEGEEAKDVPPSPPLSLKERKMSSSPKHKQNKSHHQQQQEEEEEKAVATAEAKATPSSPPLSPKESEKPSSPEHKKAHHQQRAEKEEGKAIPPSPPLSPQEREKPSSPRHKKSHHHHHRQEEKVGAATVEAKATSPSPPPSPNERAKPSSPIHKKSHHHHRHHQKQEEGVARAEAKATSPSPPLSPKEREQSSSPKHKKSHQQQRAEKQEEGAARAEAKATSLSPPLSPKEREQSSSPKHKKSHQQQRAEKEGVARAEAKATSLSPPLSPKEREQSSSPKHKKSHQQQRVEKEKGVTTAGATKTTPSSPRLSLKERETSSPPKRKHKKSHHHQQEQQQEAAAAAEQQQEAAAEQQQEEEAAAAEQQQEAAAAAAEQEEATPPSPPLMSPKERETSSSPKHKTSHHPSPKQNTTGKIEKQETK